MNWITPLASVALERGRWWPNDPVGQALFVVGMVGQTAFLCRFLVQWIASERRGKSYMPIAFWYLSIAGSLLLAPYVAFWKHDPIVTAGVAFNSIVYLRNLALLRRTRAVESPSE